MGLSVETLTLLQETACKAEGAKVIRLPDDPRNAILQNGRDIEPITIPPPARNHTVYTLKDLIELARQELLADSSPKSVLWIDDSSVVCVLDDQDRRDKATFKLRLTERFELLSALATSKRAYNQVNFIRLLRFDLGIDPLIVNKFRYLKFETMGAAEAELQKTGDRFGSTGNTAVKGNGDLPETIEVLTPIYREDGEQAVYSFTCDIDFIIAEKTIMILPKQDDLDAAVWTQQQDIRQRMETAFYDAELSRSIIPIYYGKP